MDLVGKKFGRLTVIKKVKIKGKRSFRYCCKCKCGNEIFVKTSELMSGNTRSCGCLQKEIAKKNSLEKNLNLKGLTSMREDNGTKPPRVTNQSTGIRNIMIDNRTGYYIVKITRNKKLYKQAFSEMDRAIEAKQKVLKRFLSGEANWNENI